MGCFYCKPTTTVTEDPDVAVFAKVSTCAIIFPRTEWSQGGPILLSADMDGSGENGMFYVRGNRLHYNTTIAEGTRFKCGCWGDRWRVSKITKVEVVTGTLNLSGIRTKSGQIRALSMHPGVRVTFENKQVLVARMTDARNFCAKLRQIVDHCQGKDNIQHRPA